MSQTTAVPVGGAGDRPTQAPNTPNELIRRARLARRSFTGSGRVLSRQELAEAVNAWVLTHLDRRVYLDRLYIGKLERGEIRWPAGHVRAGLRGVLAAESDGALGLFNLRGASRPAETCPPAIMTAPESAVSSAPVPAIGEIATFQVTVSAGATVTIAFPGGGAPGAPPVRVLLTAMPDVDVIQAAPHAATGGARVYSLAARARGGR